MRITESQTSINTLTKCTKMTEEGHRRHGMNGNADGSAGIKEESCRSTYNSGGRLKFFKDGKFILELERAREGERVSWVSVPRKTFWPPQGTASTTPTYRQESSTSLSVSDDNSSVQSSPWQRDHSWKQALPRKNLSVEMCFYFHCSKRQHRVKVSHKARKPYSKSPERNNSVNRTRLCNSDVKCKGKKLMNIVQVLAEKCASTASELLNKASMIPSRAEQVVSPRKRILRELEKVTIEDISSHKRCRNKPQLHHSNQQQSSHLPSNKVVPNCSSNSSPVRMNGTTTTIAVSTASNSSSPAALGVIKTEDVKPSVTSKNNCSYSINSLLSSGERRKESPPSLPPPPPSHYSAPPPPPPASSSSQYCSPGREDVWYSGDCPVEQRLRSASVELPQVPDKRVLPPYPTYPYVPSYIYPYHLPSYYSASVYGRGYMVPPVYSAPPLPPPLHLRHHDTPSCSWNSEPPPSFKEEHNKDDSDMPLNLSKHGG